MPDEPTTPLIHRFGGGPASASDGSTPLLWYNGIALPGLVRVRMTVMPDMDASGRVSQGTKYQLVGHGFLSPASISQEESQFHDLPRKLVEPGKELKIFGFGYGNLIVNPAAGTATPAEGRSVHDIANGPRPEMAEFTPLGGTGNFEYVWKVEFTLLDCESQGGFTGSVPELLSIAYQMDYSTDQTGRMTRTISGQAVAPAGRTIEDIDIEAIRRDRLKFEVPQQFRRASSRVTVSNDRRTLDFNIVDEELMGGAFPPGIADATVNYEIANSEPHNFVSFRMSLSAEYEVAMGYHPALAAHRFFVLLLEKVQALREIAYRNGRSKVIPIDVRMAHQMYTRRSSFYCSWELIDGTLNDLVEFGKIWDPGSESNYLLWRSSMIQQGVWSHNGSSRIVSRDDPLLVSRCDGDNVVEVGRSQVFPRQPLMDVTGIFNCDDCTPERSWIAYDEKWTGTNEPNLVSHELSSSELKNEQMAAEAAGDGTDFDRIDGIKLDEEDFDETNIVYEKRGIPTTYILRQGRALRCKFKPVVPDVDTYDGVEIRKVAKNVQVGLKTVIFGCPIYWAKWAILYKPIRSVGTMENMPNPVKSIDDTER